MNYFVSALISIIGLAILRTLYLEALTIFRVLRYKSQGLENVEYFFWLSSYFKKKELSPEESADIYYNVKEMQSKSNETQPFSVIGINGMCGIALNSHEAIAEFYKKEIDHTVKRNYFVTLKFLAFFFENGKKAHDGRGTFSKIFHYSNVISLLPQIHQSVQIHVERLRKRVTQAKDQKLKVNLMKEFILDLFEDLTGCILLTGADHKIRATFDGMSISQVLKKMFKCFEAHPRQLISWIPFTERLGLSKPANEFRRLQKGFNKIITDQYKQRYNSTNEEDLAENSILDIMVRLNKKSERETGKPQFTLKEISDNFEAFQFAGSDTSSHASCSLMIFLAQPENQEIQEKLSSEIKTELEGAEELDNVKLNSLNMLDMCFRETMRMANPAPVIFPRVVVKDFTICGHPIKKGDLISQYLVQYQPAYYKDPFKFLPERFSEEAKKKIPYTKQIFFSHGKRGCIGKYLGEMMVKLIVSEMVKNFKFEVEEGYEMRMGMNPIYGVANPDLILSLRKD